MRRVIVVMVAVLTALVLGGGVSEASRAQTLAESPTPTATRTHVYVGNADGSIMYPAGSTQAEALVRSLGALQAVPTGAIETRSTSHGVLAPAWTIGAGWYVYVYLNNSDINWLVGLGYTAATGVLCWWLAPTFGGAIACGAAAYAVWSAIQPYVNVNKPGYCLEVSLNWWGGLHGTKWVRRNC